MSAPRMGRPTPNVASPGQAPCVARWRGTRPDACRQPFNLPSRNGRLPRGDSSPDCSLQLAAHFLDGGEQAAGADQFLNCFEVAVQGAVASKGADVRADVGIGCLGAAPG